MLAVLPVAAGPNGEGGGLGSALLMVLVITVVAIVVSFLVGSLSPATLLANLFGKDLRGSGSGNPGATNAGRVLGVKWGVLVGVLDVLKGLVPVLVAQQALGLLLACVCGVFVVLGHMFSPFLKGRGGKGVATTLGVLLGVAPWIALVALVTFGVAYAVTRRVGEASVITALVLLLVGALQGLDVVELARIDMVGVFVAVLAVLVLARHRRNIIVAIERRRRQVAG